MGTLPTLTVLLDDGTGTYPFDISRYVLSDGYEISRGRDDWQAAVTAGELTLTLNNSDGRFTPGSTLIASPSPIVVDQRIRLYANGDAGFGIAGFGISDTRFTGYVKSWPVSWPETVATFSKVQLTATDAQARAERRTLRSSLEEEILSDHPTAYYTLGEAEGASAAGDSSGSGKGTLAAAGSGTAVAFGNGTGPVDGLPAPTFAGGQYLSGRGATFIGTGSAFTVEFFFATSMAAPAFVSPVLAIDDGSDFLGVILVVNTSGKIQVNFGGNLLVSSASVNDGLIHHVALTLTIGGVLTLYLDGVSVASGAGTVLPGDDLIRLGLAPSNLAVTTPFIGTLSHVAIHTAALSAARVGQHSAAGHDFVGESGTARLSRVAGYGGIPVGTLDSSLTNVAASALSGKSVQSVLQETADAEFGLVFVDGTGSLVFHNRNRVVAKTAPDLILSSQYVTPDVAPVSDDQQLLNYMEVTAEGTGATSVVRNTTSEGTHGRYPGSRSYLVQTDAEAIDRANWLVANLAEPTTRYGTLTINLFGMPPSLASSVLDLLDLNCWLRVTSMASQNPGGVTADVIVQGWTETASADTWQITCNVVSRSLYAPVWIFGTSTFGTTTRFYV